MNKVGIWNLVINSGVCQTQTHTFSDKLITRNKLALFCALFSLMYVVFFLSKALYLPLTAIVTGIVLFVAAIGLNKLKLFTLSSILIIINTNYCVLFFSIYLGFNSGIHLYLFTSPLIVLTAFDTKNIKLIALVMLSYIANFILIMVLGKHFQISILQLSPAAQNAFYTFNFACAIFILITLSLYFLHNNNTINSLLVFKNAQLEEQKNLLSEENSTRKDAEEKAKESLAQKEILLSEIHHRVKNNLAVIHGLLELQGVYLTDNPTIRLIKESQNRIKSIAILHEKLYENKTLKEVNLRSYTLELIEFVKLSLSDKNKDIEIISHIESIDLEMTMAMPFALLINELISNSYKHAFTFKNSGQIIIKFSAAKEGYLFIYKDNGVGFDYLSGEKRESLGLTLIETFVEQLNGEFKFVKDNTGMQFELRFMN
ncbi:MAG: signal transduction histidine kinase [Bacteroidetes bacterium]|nr:signal transduction histidine kinase [Bacteroidota bacterium]